MERPDISPTVKFTSSFSAHSCFWRKKFSHAAKAVRHGEKLSDGECETVHEFTFQSLHLVIAESAGYTG